MARSACEGCHRRLAWNGGELVAGLELCPRCAARARRESAAAMAAAEAAGQVTLFEGEEAVRRVEPPLGGLFEE